MNGDVTLEMVLPSRFYSSIQCCSTGKITLKLLFCLEDLVRRAAGVPWMNEAYC